MCTTDVMWMGVVFNIKNDRVMQVDECDKYYCGCYVEMVVMR